MIRAVAVGAMGVLAAGIAGCASLGKPPPYAAELPGYAVDPVVVAKMEARKPLEIEELVHLSSQKVPDDVIVEHVKTSRAVYQLTTEDVDRLREEGLSADVIDFLLATPGLYRQYHAPYPHRPYYGSGFHFGHYHYPHHAYRYYRPYHHGFHRYHR